MEWRCGLVFAAVLVSAAGVEAATGGQDDTPAVLSEDSAPPRTGLWVTSDDGELDVRFFGLLMIDSAFQRADPEIEALVGEEIDNAMIARRARLGAEGTLYGAVDFKIDYDFAPIEDEPRDLVVAYGLPIGYLRVGHMKDPIGLEKLASSRHLTFLERGLPATVDRTRKMGFDLTDTISAANATWTAGLFIPTDAKGQTMDGDAYAVVGRLTAAPILAREGRRLLHLGAAYSWQDTPNNTWRIRRRPENFLAPHLLDTGDMPGKSWQVAALEAAWVHDSFSLQGETFLAKGEVTGAANPGFTGAYLMGSWFLTGEHRPYQRKKAVFGRIRPKHVFGKGGPGAVELAARYSWLDLTDAGIDGGEMQQVTLGANWYLNPFSKIMLNVLSGELEREGVNGDIHAVLLRFQVDF